MDKIMHGLVTYAPYDSRYEEIEIPDIEEDEILLKILGCGICAGDIKAYHGGVRVWGTQEEDRYIETPVIGGHEYFGEIIKLGSKCTKLQVGDRVCAEQIVPCNECEFCKKGHYWMCAKSDVYGFKKHAQGGFAEYLKLHRNSIVHKVPESFSIEQGVLIEPLACGMHAVELADIRHSDVVVIAGLGAIGSSMVNMAGLRLPRLIIGVDVRENRLKKGKELGADIVLNPERHNLEEEIKKITGGRGCDAYIEASGNPKSVGQGMSMLKNNGKFVQMGVFSREVTADWNIIGDGKELTIIGSHLSALTYPSVIRGINNGLIRTDGLISHTFKLSQWKKAFKTAEENGDVMKVMLIPD